MKNDTWTFSGKAGRSQRVRSAELVRALSQAERPLRIILVDDDPLFSRMLSKRAGKDDIMVTCCIAIRDLREAYEKMQYDVAIVDYNLRHLKGSNVARLLGDIPVVMVSSSDEVFACEDQVLQSVKCCMNKREGLEAIVDRAIEFGLHSLARNSERIHW